VCDYARTAELLVIADAKRGDIGSTARAYAAAFVEPRSGEGPLADAVTVNAYLGRGALEPFLAACRRDGAGLFCLVKPSNAGSRRRCGGTPRARGLDRLRLVTRRYAAPAAFLLAVTIAVLAIHYGVQRRPAAKSPVTATAATTPPPPKRKPATTRYYVVQRG